MWLLKLIHSFLEYLGDKYSWNIYLDGHSGIEDWNFVIFEQCETYAQYFGNIDLKLFNP